MKSTIEYYEKIQCHIMYKIYHRNHCMSIVKYLVALQWLYTGMHLQSRFIIQSWFTALAATLTQHHCRKANCMDDQVAEWHHHYHH